MRHLAQWVEQFWWRNQPPSKLLQPLSAIYQWFNARNLHARAKRAVPPPLPVVFVGNITVGGSGKTPFVLALARALRQRGFEPVIVCRGDGGGVRKPRQVRGDDDPAVVGDEACMMAQAGIAPVIAGRDRVAGAALAATVGDVMLLDDGLQYRQLARVDGRSCEVVLLPAEGVGNGALLPVGPLREPVSSLQRADMIVISGDWQGRAFPTMIEGIPRFHWHHSGVTLREVMGYDSEVSPETVHLVTAIARPFRVVEALHHRGITVQEHTQFADHYRYRIQDVERLCRQPNPVVTTAKDAVKLRRLWPDHRALWVCEQPLQIDRSIVDRVVASIGGAG